MQAVYRDLMGRRVPHFVGSYIAGSWMTLELLSWLVDRYVLSEHLIDFALLLLILFAPAALIVAYFHGAPGRNQSPRFERAALGANLAVAVVVLLVVFSGTDLGAATTKVTVTNESGQSEAVRIPKSEFVRRVALFPFADHLEDPDLYWLPLGLEQALLMDLSQDPFLSVSRPGPYTGEDTPFAQKLDQATGRGLQFLVSGALSRVDGGLAATVSLHDVQSGRLLRERHHVAPDLFALTDSISIRLKSDIGIPAGHLRTVRDLPSSELLTSSEDAFRLYIEGMGTGSFPERAEKLRAATAEDPTFALAHFNLYGTLRGMGRRSEAAEALESAMEHSYRMAEDDRNLLRIQYFWVVERDAPKALRVAERWAVLSPEYVSAHRWVAEMREVLGDLEGAIAAHRRILEVDSLATGSLSAIATLEESRGRFQEALEALEAYGRLAPENGAYYLSAARLQRLLGRHEAAAESCEEARLLEPGSVPALRCLGAIEVDLGHLQEARSWYDRAMELSRSPADRGTVHLSLAALYQRLGQPSRALEEQALYGAGMEGAGTLPTAETSRRTALLPLLVEAGRTEEAFDTLEVIRTRVEPGWSFLRWQAEIVLSGLLADPDRLAPAVDSMATYESFAPLVIAPDLAWGRARLQELKGNLAEAATLYREALDLSPRDTGTLRDLARVDLALGDPSQARETLASYLVMYPYEPKGRVALAKVMLALGERQEALEHLDAALSVWADAESGFQPAQEARTLRAQVAESIG